MASISGTSQNSMSRRPILATQASRHRNHHVRIISTRATRYTLNIGTQIPALGFGTFQDPASQENTICRAFKKCMRLIDTAHVYNVETQVGRGIKKSGIPREDKFVGTKLWYNEYHPEDGVSVYVCEGGGEVSEG